MCGEMNATNPIGPVAPIVLPERGWVLAAGAPAQDWRNYSVRHHRPDAGEVDVDVVLHEPRGPACTWAARVPLGAPVGYAGPRVDFSPRADAEWLLLCGDEARDLRMVLREERGVPRTHATARGYWLRSGEWALDD